MRYVVEVLFTCFGRVVVDAPSSVAAEKAVEQKNRFSANEVELDRVAGFKVDTVVEGNTEVAK